MGKLKSLEDWPNSPDHHLLEFRQQSLQKSDTLAKMLVPSLKISTSIILNLAKIGLNEVKQIYQEMKDKQKMSVEDQVFNDLADAMLGKDWSNE